jgi:hypothetical protein
VSQLVLECARSHPVVISAVDILISGADCYGKRNKRYELQNFIVTCRHQVEKKKRENGCNPFGRRGNLPCAQCRKRNSKISWKR